MSLRKISFTEKVPIMRALGVFLVVSTLIVLVNSLLRHSIRVNFSISRYVGLESWSAILFFISNLVVASWIAAYLYELGRILRMPRVYYWLVVGVVVMLVGLSICPLGFFDRYRGLGGASIMHQICSRLMFILMALITLMVILNRSVCLYTKVVGGIFLCYMIICIIGHLLKINWFVGHFLIFEALYLVAFMLFCSLCQTEDEIKVAKD